jgi:hypothetical protein
MYSRKLATVLTRPDAVRTTSMITASRITGGSADLPRAVPRKGSCLRRPLGMITGVRQDGRSRRGMPDSWALAWLLRGRVCPALPVHAAPRSNRNLKYAPRGSNPADADSG